MEPSHTQSNFPTTQWSIVLTLKTGDDEAHRLKALNTLCSNYWYALYAFARRKGNSPHNAEDAVQSFFLNIAGADYFKKADANRGKLRTFLLTGFSRYLGDLRDHRTALKRGGGVLPISLDTDQAEEWLSASESVHSPSLTFEQDWAKSTLRAALAALEKSAQNTPAKAHRFQILKVFLDPGAAPNLNFTSAADQLGITVESCTTAVRRLRRDFKTYVEQHIANTLQAPTPETVFEEMKELQNALSKS